MNISARFCSVAAALVLSACTSLGPIVIGRDRTLYNEALQQTESQQLLLNIVRQRYNDPVLFLDVTSLSSSVTRSASAGLSAFLPNIGSNSYTGEVSGELEESPVVFYAPNNGEKFVRQMLTPIDLRTITLVLQSGWSIERVLLVTGETINSYKNATAAAGPASETSPDDHDFAGVAAALRDLQRNNDLTLGVERGATDNDAPIVTLIFTADALRHPSYNKVCTALKVPCDGLPIYITQGVGVGKAGDKNILLGTRSLFSAMYFLAQGVDVPARDVARGAVALPRDTQGNVYDWAKERSELFRILSSESEPQNTHVKVLYRGTWFYIPDTDIDSKTTFALMSMLLMLQAGDTQKITPLVTLSAG